MENFTYSSIFGELTKSVQIRIDSISEHHKRLFDNVLFEKYLDWDMPSTGLTFEEIIGQYNITVAALKPTAGDTVKLGTVTIATDNTPTFTEASAAGLLL